MRCPKCRKELREGAKFCPSCGTRVSNHKRNRGFRLFIIIILILSAILGGTGIGILAARIVGSSNSAPEIHNAEEAIAYAAELGADLGYKNAMSELSEKVTTEFDGDCYYRLQQNYQGIPVYGRSVIFVADENGQQISVTGNPLDVDEKLTIIPSVTPDEIEKQVDNYANTDLYRAGGVFTEISTPSEEDLCIYIDEKTGKSHLAYHVLVNVFFEDGSCAYYRGVVDAQDATVYRMLSLQLTDSRQFEIVNNNGKKNSIEVSETKRGNETYLELVDEDRRIRVYNIQKEALEYEVYYHGETASGTNDYSQELYDKLDADREMRKEAVLQLYIRGENGFRTELVSPDRVQTDLGIEAFDNDALSLLSGLQTTYDFFEDTLKLDGIGQPELWIEGVCNDRMPRSGSFNAYCSGMGRWAMEMQNIFISFGYENMVSLDTIAHEYTHGVEECRSGMEYSGESGAVMEALSDIFGELVEDYFLRKTQSTESVDWVHGERYLCDPGRNSDSPYPAYYLGRGWESTLDTSAEGDYGGVHTNNTVISHAAFLMWNGGKEGTNSKKISSEQLVQLWYRAMLMMPSDCTFMECRNLVLLASESMMLTQKQRDGIVEAFDLVGLTNEVVVDYQVKPDCELSVLGADGSAYDNYAVVISTCDEYQSNSLALQAGFVKNTVVTNTDPFTLPAQEGTYSVTISDNENPASSVSFVVGVNRKNTKDILQIFTEFEKQVDMDLPSRYQTYGSVRGGESTFQLNPDNTFTCVLKFYDWGDQGDDYPNGTCYISQFEGKFSKITTIDEFRLKLTVEYIEQTNQPGDQYIQDGMRFIVEEDDTLAQLKECRMYLPGTPFEFTDDCFATLDGGEKMFYIGPYYGDLQELMAGRFALELDENMLIFLGELESDGSQELENGYDASNLVSDAYSDYVPNNLYNTEGYFYIPKVNADLPEIEETNAKIYDDYYNYMQTHVYGPIEAGSNTPIDEISYIWEVKDQYLSILMYVMWAGKPSCEVYTVSLETGALVENSELLTAYGITEEGFNELVGQASQKIGDSLRWPIPYVNPETKDLCAVGGSDKWMYDKLVNLTGTTEPFYPWEIPAPERVAEALAGAE